MALNLKTFTTRTITAAFFVIALLGALLFRYELFCLFFGLVALLGAKEFLNLSQHLGAKPFKGMVLIVSGLVYLSCIKWDYWDGMDRLSPGWILLLVPFLFLVRTLFSRSDTAIQDSLYSTMAVFYAVLPMGLLHNMVIYTGSIDHVVFSPWSLFGIILLIWCNDTFAYIGGSFFGKHKLIERISPGKTIEGTAIGVGLTFALSFYIGRFMPAGSAVLQWPLLGIMVPVLATLGDLIESLLKRKAGVKDSGNLMPGHGGVLDRFDSLILVSPVLAVLWPYLQM